MGLGTPTFKSNSGPLVQPKGMGGIPGASPSFLQGATSIAQQVAPGAFPSQQLPGFAEAQKFVEGLYGPQMAGFQSIADNITGQIGFAGANADWQSGWLNTQAGFDREKLGLQEGSIGAARGDNEALRNIANQVFGVDRRAADQRYAESVDRTKGDATSRGAFNTPGFKRDLDYLAQDLANTQEKLSLGNQRDNINFDAANRELDTRASQLGIERRELESNLKKGLEKIGIDKYMQVSDLMNALQSNDLQQRALADEMFRTALEYSDYFAYNTPTPGRTKSQQRQVDKSVNSFINR